MVEQWTALTQRAQTADDGRITPASEHLGNRIVFVHGDLPRHPGNAPFQLARGAIAFAPKRNCDAPSAQVINSAHG